MVNLVRPGVRLWMLVVGAVRGSLKTWMCVLGVAADVRLSTLVFGPDSGVS